LALCAAAGVGELPVDDPVAGDRLAEAMRTRTARAWQLALDEAGVPAEVSVDTNDGELALYDADNERLGLMVDAPHPTLGNIRQFGTLINFSDTPTGPYSAPPMCGQHTREILARLGYETGAVDDLMAKHVVYEPDESYRWAQ
jgi:crotonobetainyl-CoA:carnitine CoA-transferase CaiB-like acyl-CoA transferase